MIPVHRVVRSSTAICDVYARQDGSLTSPITLFDVPILDKPTVRNPHDIGRQIFDRLPLSADAASPPREPAGDAKVADDAVAYEHLLQDVDPSIRKCLEEVSARVSESVRSLHSAGGKRAI